MATTAEAPKQIKIDVTSDSICPFCFIGKRKLERAIDIAKEKGLNMEFDIQYHPFLLDPTLKVDSPVNKRDRYSEKFGADRFPVMEKTMIARGKESGINFSHRLAALAYEQGGQKLQLDFMERIFKGYFEQEKDIGDWEFLSEQAVLSGLFANTTEAKDWLATNEMKVEVARGIRGAQMMGITGVPFFVVNNKYAISGAEESELFVEVFERLAGKKCPNGRLPNGLVHACE